MIMEEGSYGSEIREEMERLDRTQSPEYSLLVRLELVKDRFTTIDEYQIEFLDYTGQTIGEAMDMIARVWVENHKEGT